MVELVLAESNVARAWVNYNDSDDRIQGLEIDRFSRDVTVRVKIWTTATRQGVPSLDETFARQLGRANVDMASMNLEVRAFTSNDPDDVVLPTDREMSVAWSVDFFGGFD